MKEVDNIKQFIKNPKDYELLYYEKDDIHNEYALSVVEAQKLINYIDKLETNWKELKKREKYMEELEFQVAELKNEINKISKKELKIMQMLRSIELCTLTKERIDQIEQVMFELEVNNE